MNAQAGRLDANPPKRDHSMFDAELSGQVLNMRLLCRLLRWLRPYRGTVALSAVLILVSSGLQILLPVIISLAVLMLVGTLVLVSVAELIRRRDPAA